MTAVVGSAPRRIAVLGFGEAGSEYARDLVAAGADVRGFDPKIPAPPGVKPRQDDADAIRDAELVISLTTAAEAESALRASMSALRPGTLWADANTAAPALKVRLAELARDVDVDLVDVAIMAPVPGHGVHTTMCVSGPAAAHFAAAMHAFDVCVEHIAGPIGAASSQKLLRSVVYKGVAASIVEAMAGAEAAGCADWFRGHITTEFATFDHAVVSRLITGTYLHAGRRAAEMDAAAQQLADLGVTPHIATATRDALRAIAPAASEVRLVTTSPRGPLKQPSRPTPKKESE